MIKSKLKRRLRKKYHLGEFQELGFELFTALKPDLSEEDFDKFLDDFIEEIERNKLTFGGGNCLIFSTKVSVCINCYFSII